MLKEQEKKRIVKREKMKGEINRIKGRGMAIKVG